MTAPFLMPVPPFLFRLEVDKVLASFRGGMHRSAIGRQGVEFRGIRPYDSSSDRPADINYPASMKLSEDLDLLLSRTRYTEREISVVTVIDVGETMRVPPRKLEYASALLWLFALSALKYSDRFRLILCSSKGVRDSDWLRSEGDLVEWIAHAGPSSQSLAGDTNSANPFFCLAHLELKDTFVAVISDFATKREKDPQELTRLGMFERNIKMVLLALDEWSDFVPTGYGMVMQDPRTGATNYFTGADLLSMQRSAKAWFEEIVSIVKPLAVPFISIPLLADPLEIVRQEWLRHGSE